MVEKQNWNHSIWEWCGKDMIWLPVVLFCWITISKSRFQNIQKLKFIVLHIVKCQLFQSTFQAEPAAVNGDAPPKDAPKANGTTADGEEGAAKAEGEAAAAAKKKPAKKSIPAWATLSKAVQEKMKQDKNVSLLTALRQQMIKLNKN